MDGGAHPACGAAGYSHGLPSNGLVQACAAHQSPVLHDRAAFGPHQKFACMRVKVAMYSQSAANIRMGS
eukprot:4945728-Heterocapsa_arctica.AAC.1